MAEENKTFFDKRVKPTLKYVGSIGAVITTIVYIIIVFMMIFGFSVSNFQQALAFAIVNAVVGLIIMQFLKIQGIAFAKAIPENEKILKEYADAQPKKARTHSIKFYWVTSIIKDVIIKAAMTALTTAGIIYIVIQGSRDYILLLLALANLLMFVCYGLVSLVNAYDFFNEKHVPFIQEKIDERKEEKKQALAAEEERRKAIERENSIEAEVKKRLEMAEAERLKQRNVCVSDICRTDILESCNNNGNNSTIPSTNVGDNGDIHSDMVSTCDSRNSLPAGDMLCAEKSVEETKITEEQTQC